MTDHLPECLALLNDSTWDGSCICSALRACEQRVQARYSAYLNADNEGSYAAGFRDAMHAAREAVLDAGLCAPHRCQSDALAAIDALKEKR